MTRFSLEEWLKDKSRKVVTRNGKTVRIVCWDKLGEYPIIGCVKYSDDYEDLESYDINGFKYSFDREDQNDLFFADEEKELTEFEKELDIFLYNSKLKSDRPNYYDWLLKTTASKLLNLARKEFYSEMTDTLQLEYKQEVTEALRLEYEKGRADVLKEFPIWRKAEEDIFSDDIDYVYLYQMDGGDYEYYSVVRLTNRVHKGEYYIKLEDLLKLPSQ